MVYSIMQQIQDAKNPTLNDLEQYSMVLNGMKFNAKRDPYISDYLHEMIERINSLKIMMRYNEESFFSPKKVSGEAQLSKFEEIRTMASLYLVPMSPEGKAQLDKLIGERAVPERYYSLPMRLTLDRPPAYTGILTKITFSQTIIGVGLLAAIGFFIGLGLVLSMGGAPIVAVMFGAFGALGAFASAAGLTAVGTVGVISYESLRSGLQAREDQALREKYDPKRAKLDSSEALGAISQGKNTQAPGEPFNASSPTPRGSKQTRNHPGAEYERVSQNNPRP